MAGHRTKHGSHKRKQRPSDVSIDRAARLKKGFPVKDPVTGEVHVSTEIPVKSPPKAEPKPSNGKAARQEAEASEFGFTRGVQPKKKSTSKKKRKRKRK